MEEKDDLALIEEAKKDTGLFGVIYLKYFKKIYTFVWRRVGRSAAIAEDIVQETFLQAFKHIGRFKNKSVSYLAYLFTIARNLVISYYRKKKTASLEAAEEISVEPMMAVVEALDAKSLLQNLNKIKPSYRTVLQMKYVEQLPIRVIARGMHKSENAIKLMLYRAKKAVREKSQNNKH